MYKRLYIIGIAAYALMLLLSVIFYRERILFLDPAFALFQIINDGTFCIQNYRFGDAFAQIIPLLSYKAGLSVNSMIMGYSIGLMSIYFLSYIICGSILKQYRYAVLILLLNVLFTADTFYWPISQVPQGMALLVLILALIEGKRIKDLKPAMWVVLGLLLITLVFFHPLMALALIYSLVFFMLRNDELISRKLSYLIVFFFLVLLVVKMILFNVPYERHSLSGLKNFIRLYPDYINLYSNKQLLHNCVKKYYWMPIIGASIIILYIRDSAWKKLGFFTAVVFGYLLVTDVSYPSAITPAFYIENLYLLLGLFFGLPFLFDVVPALEKRRVAFPLLVLIIFTGCLRLYSSHTSYTARLHYEQQLLNEYEGKKIIVDAKNVDTAELQMLWGTPYEFLLLSLSEGHKPASIIIDEDPPHRMWAEDQKKSLVVNWNIFPYAQLNATYFHFTDTTTGYVIDAPRKHL